MANLKDLYSLTSSYVPILEKLGILKQQWHQSKEPLATSADISAIKNELVILDSKLYNTEAISSRLQGYEPLRARLVSEEKAKRAYMNGESLLLKLYSIIFPKAVSAQATQAPVNVVSEIPAKSDFTYLMEGNK